MSGVQQAIDQEQLAYEEAAAEADMEERLTSLFAQEEPAKKPAADEEPAEAIEVEEEEPKAEAKTAEEKDEKDDDTEEVEFEGKTYHLPKEIKGALERHKDYTQKTMEVAREREVVVDREQYQQAREHLVTSAFTQMADVHHLQTALKEYENVNWAALIETDHAQAMKLDMQRQKLREQLGEAQQKLQIAVGQSQQAYQQHTARQWELAVRGARERLGNVSADDDLAALQQARELGFTDKEIPVRLADARLLVALFKMAKWEALQKAKPEVRKRVEATAKPMKPSSRSAGSGEGTRASQARTILKKTGSAKAAEAYLEQRYLQRNR